MSDKIGSRLLRLISCTMLVLLSLYVLSFGPVVASIHTTAGTPPEYVAPLETFYAPLIWVMERFSPFEDIAIDYVKLCGSPFYSPDPPQ